MVPVEQPEGDPPPTLSEYMALKLMRLESVTEPDRIFSISLTQKLESGLKLGEVVDFLFFIFHLRNRGTDSMIMPASASFMPSIGGRA